MYLKSNLLKKETQKYSNWIYVNYIRKIKYCVQTIIFILMVLMRQPF